MLFVIWFYKIFMGGPRSGLNQPNRIYIQRTDHLKNLRRQGGPTIKNKMKREARNFSLFFWKM